MTTTEIGGVDIFSDADHEPAIYSGLSVFNWLGDHLAKNFGDFAKLEPEAYCGCGVSVSHSSADPTQIRHGLQQLRLALPNLLRTICLLTDGYVKVPLPIVASVLVTNAPIRVLKEGVNISDAESCRSLDEITNVHHHIDVYQSISPELEALCAKVAKEVCDKLPNPVGLDLEDYRKAELVYAVECVTVVALEHLPHYLKSVYDTIQDLTFISMAKLQTSTAKYCRSRQRSLVMTLATIMNNPLRWAM